MRFEMSRGANTFTYLSKTSRRKRVYSSCVTSARNPFTVRDLNGCCCLLNEKIFTQHQVCLHWFQQKFKSVFKREWHYVIAYLFTWEATQWLVENQFAPNYFRVLNVFILWAGFLFWPYRKLTYVNIEKTSQDIACNFFSLKNCF